MQNNITQKRFLKYVKKHTMYVAIQMLTAIKSLYSDIDGY